MPTKKLGSIKMTDNVLTPTVNVGTEATGTLPVANGGTGQTTYTNGQLLIGNTTGNTLTKATLTPGTGISITNGAGSITIASTGGGAGDVVGDDTTTTVQNIVAYNTTGGKNITELTGTRGDVLYHNGTSWVKLAAGTSGNFLKTNGAAANPAWSAVQFASGSAGSPGVTFTSDTGTGMFLPSVQVLGFSSNATERARFTSTGYLKVAPNGSYRGPTINYHEITQTNNTATLFLRNSVATPSAGSFLVLEYSAAAPDNNTERFLACSDNVTDRCIIYSDGDLANHDGTYGTISDERLKQDIVDAPSQWDDIKAVRFRKYRMKSDVAANPDAPYMLGVVAQEIQQTSPLLVDEHQNPDGTTTMSVKSSILLTKAAKALQEAMARIETLETEMAALKAIVTP